MGGGTSAAVGASGGRQVEVAVDVADESLFLAAGFLASRFESLLDSDVEPEPVPESDDDESEPPDDFLPLRLSVL